ncbi:conserved membrane protein [Bacillus sp. 349Y]|nr:conserved membrane protein [Bacillus sp. 349Y]
MKTFIIIGAINAFLSVALGAFGAHALEGKISAKYIETWNTGVQYQMFHAIGILIIGVMLGNLAPSSLLSWSGWLMLIGTILFSGSLYVLSLSGIKVLGAITQLGGVSFLAAWVLLIIFAAKNL